MTKAQAYRDFQSEDIPVIKSPFGALLDVNTLLKSIHFQKQVPQDEIVQLVAVAVKDASSGKLVTEESLKEMVAHRLNQEYYPEYMGIKMEEKTYIPPFMKELPLFTDSPFGIHSSLFDTPMFKGLDKLPKIGEFGMGLGLASMPADPKETIKAFLSKFVPAEEVEEAMEKAEALMNQEEDREDANDALMSALIDNYGLTYMQAKEVSDMDDEDVNLILDIVERAHKRGRADQKRLQGDESAEFDI